MQTQDLDPNYGLPLWQAIVTYFSRFRPLIQADQKLPHAPGQETS